MRLEPVRPDQLSDEQRPLHDGMTQAVDEHLKGFVSRTDDGALIGPFPPLLHYPAWGRGAWEQTKSLLDHTGVPKPAHEVAILVTAAAYRARYELYAHERVARDVGLSEAKIAALVAGQRPGGMDDQEAAAFDLASALVRGGPLPDATYNFARDQFGDDGVAELIYLVGGYCLVSVLLNGFAMPTPDGDV